jgi:hypothetical protein
MRLMEENSKGGGMSQVEARHRNVQIGGVGDCARAKALLASY